MSRPPRALILSLPPLATMTSRRLVPVITSLRLLPTIVARWARPRPPAAAGGGGGPRRAPARPRERALPAAPDRAAGCSTADAGPFAEARCGGDTAQVARRASARS